MFVTVATELPRILACNGSRLLGGIAPPSNDDPTARNEGIAAHWLITRCFENAETPAAWVGKKAPNGVTITNAISSAVDDYVDTISEESKRAAYNGYGMERTGAIYGQNWRVDLRTDFFSFDGQTLNIRDYKHGFRIVEPENNWTLIAYALSICNDYNILPMQAVLTIHQPRISHPRGPVRSYRLTQAELLNRYNHINNVLSNPSDLLQTGPQCDKCPNVTVCPALHRAAFNAVDVSMTAHAEDMPDSQIGRELDILTDAEKRLKTRKKQLEDLAAWRLKKGAIIENYALETAYGNSAFNDGFTPEFLSAMLGVNCVKQESITPTQAIKAGAPKLLVEKFSGRKETGLKLTRVSAHDRAVRMFGKG